MSPELIISLVVAAGGWAYSIYNGVKLRKYELEDHARDREEKIEDQKSSVEDTVKKMKEDQDNFIKEMRSDQEKFILAITKQITDMNAKVDNLTEGEMLLLKKTIIDIANYYIDRGKITLRQRKEIHNMHSVYHFKLKGNGGLDSVMEAIDELEVIPDDY